LCLTKLRLTMGQLNQNKAHKAGLTLSTVDTRVCNNTMWQTRTIFSLTHIYLTKLVNLLTSALFHSLHIILLRPLLLSPLVVVLSPVILKYYHSAPSFVKQSPI